MDLKAWHLLINKHFQEPEYEMFVPERGWGERVVKRTASRLDPYRSEWRAARLLGGTLAAVCRKAVAAAPVAFDESYFAAQLRCPDFHAAFSSDASYTLHRTQSRYQ